MVFLPARGDSLLHCHAAGTRYPQAVRRIFAKPRFVQQTIEQGVHPSDDGYGLFLEGLAEIAQRPRAGDQNIVRATYEKTQEVHGERKDMVERQRGQDMIAFPHVVAPETEPLRHVHDQISVRQHRPLAHARRAAGILQACDGGGFHLTRVALDIGPRANAGRAQRKRFRKNGMTEMRMRHLFLDVFLHKSDELPRRHWKKARRPGQNDMRHRNLFHSRRKLAREHVDRDDRGRFRVRENMRHFMRGIERIDIDEHAARLENAECGDRIGEPVWDLDRDPGSRLEVQRFAQIGGEGVRSSDRLQQSSGLPPCRSA